MRGRGLKQVMNGDLGRVTGVAPHAGAWIETSGRGVGAYPRHVAPHAGAWIETR